MSTGINCNEEVDIAEALTLAMRGLAKSVVLISTASENGERRVMVATAVTPLSMDPPSMLMCINRNVSSYPTLSAGMDFCINLLDSNHESLAQYCTQPAEGESRFQKGCWDKDEYGIPFLSDAQAAVICTQDKRISYGTHDIFIGKVRKVYTASHVDPLVYVDREYRRTEQLISQT